MRIFKYLTQLQFAAVCNVQIQRTALVPSEAMRTSSLNNQKVFCVTKLTESKY